MSHILTHGTSSQCPEVLSGRWPRCFGHRVGGPDRSSATLALELHLLATLLERHKHLVHVTDPVGGLTSITRVSDHSNELHPSLGITLWSPPTHRDLTHDEVVKMAEHHAQYFDKDNPR